MCFDRLSFTIQMRLSRVRQSYEIIIVIIYCLLSGASSAIGGGPLLGDTARRRNRRGGVRVGGRGGLSSDGVRAYRAAED